jgi:hypothetical protein
MFIVWGSRVVGKALGRVADFCPICRGVQPFKITKFDRFGHLYWIPLERHGTVGFVKRCETCSIELAESVDAHDSYSRDRSANVVALMDTVGPRLRDRVRERLALERRALEGALTEEERTGLLIEPFLCLNPRADQGGGPKGNDPAATLCFLGAFVVPLLILWICESTRIVPLDVESKLAVAAGMVLLVATFFLKATARGRSIRRVLIPRLAQTLRPLRPSAEELDRTIELLRRKQLRIGQSVNPSALYQAIASSPY